MNLSRFLQYNYVAIRSKNLDDFDKFSITISLGISDCIIVNTYLCDHINVVDRGYCSSRTRLLRALAERHATHGPSHKFHPKEIRTSLAGHEHRHRQRNLYDTVNSRLSKRLVRLIQGPTLSRKTHSDIPNRTTKSQPCLTNLSGTLAHALTARAPVAGMSLSCQTIKRRKKEEQRDSIDQKRRSDG